MKWVVHSASPHISLDAVRNLFSPAEEDDENRIEKAEPVVVCVRLDEALLLLGKQLSAAEGKELLRQGFPTTASNIGSSSSGSSAKFAHAIEGAFFGPQVSETLALPSCPMRAKIDEIFQEHVVAPFQQQQQEEQEQTQHRLASRTRTHKVVLVSITSYTRLDLEHRRHLTPQLAQSTRIDSRVYAAPSSSFDEFLHLNFGCGRRRFHENAGSCVEGSAVGSSADDDAGRVELRMASEWDSLVDALFASPSFREACGRISLCVSVSLCEEQDDHRPHHQHHQEQQQQSKTLRELRGYRFWYVADQHLDDFIEGSAHRGAQLPFSFGFSLLTSSPQCHQYARVAQALSGGGGSARQQQLSHGGATPGSAATPTSTPMMTLTRGHDTDTVPTPPSRMFQQQIAEQESSAQRSKEVTLQSFMHDKNASAEAIRALQTRSSARSGAAEECRNDIRAISDVHDELEHKFVVIANSFAEDKRALREAAKDAQEASAELTRHTSAANEMESKYGRLSAAASALSLERDRVAEAVEDKQRALQVADSERSQQRQEVDVQLRGENDRHAAEMRRLAQDRDATLQEARARHQSAVDNATAAAQAHFEQQCREQHAVGEQQQEATRERDAAALSFTQLQTTLAALRTESDAVRKKLHAARNTPEMRSFQAWPAEKKVKDYATRLQLKDQDVTRQLEDGELRARDLQERRNVLSDAVKTMEGRLDAQARVYDGCRSQLVAASRDTLGKMLQQCVQLEQRGRNIVACEYATTLELLRVEEMWGWRTAIQLTEASCHDSTHAELRQQLAETHRAILKVRGAAQDRQERNSYYQGKIRDCQEKHSLAVAEGIAQRDALASEEQTIMEGAGDRDTIAALLVLDDAESSLAERVEVVRRCLSHTAGLFLDAVENIAATAPRSEQLGRRPELASDAWLLPASAAEVEQMLRNALQQTYTQIDLHHSDIAASRRKLTRHERELEERREVLARLRSNIRETERRVGHFEETIDAKRAQVTEAQLHDKHLQQQLKGEYVLAQEVSARHRAESKQQVAALQDRFNQLELQRGRAEKEIGQLRLLRDESRLANSATSEATLRLEIQNQLRRKTYLEAELAQERRSTIGRSFAD